MSKYKVPPLSREYISLQASNIRKVTKTEDDFLFPVENLIEILLECIGGNTEVLEDKELPSNIPAKTISYPNINLIKDIPYTVIQMKKNVYLGAIAGNPEDRFTLAHELGHAFLLHGCVNNDYVCKKDEIMSSKENPEWQADIFAKELLAPSHLFKRFNHNFIAKVCNIPIKYAKEQSDYIIAEELIEISLRKTYSKNSEYVINNNEIPYPLDQTLLVPLNSPFFRKLRIKNNN